MSRWDVNIYVEWEGADAHFPHPLFEVGGHQEALEVDLQGWFRFHESQPQKLIDVSGKGGEMVVVSGNVENRTDMVNRRKLSYIRGACTQHKSNSNVECNPTTGQHCSSVLAGCAKVVFEGIDGNNMIAPKHTVCGAEFMRGKGCMYQN